MRKTFSVLAAVLPILGALTGAIVRRCEPDLGLNHPVPPAWENAVTLLFLAGFFGGWLCAGLQTMRERVVKWIIFGVYPFAAMIAITVINTAINGFFVEGFGIDPLF